MRAERLHSYFIPISRRPDSGVENSLFISQTTHDTLFVQFAFASGDCNQSSSVCLGSINTTRTVRNAIERKKKGIETDTKRSEPIEKGNRIERRKIVGNIFASIC